MRPRLFNSRRSTAQAAAQGAYSAEKVTKASALGRVKADAAPVTDRAERMFSLASRPAISAATHAGEPKPSGRNSHANRLAKA